MIVRHRRCRRGSGLLLLGVLIAGVGVGPTTPAARAQEESRPAPDLAELEKRFEEGFAAAIEFSDGDPFETEASRVIQVWGMVIQSAVMVEHVRAQQEGGEASGRPVSAQATERVFERWRRLRPESSGPDLIQALQIGDEAQRRAAVVALLDRYPDDPLVVQQATWQLRSGGESGRATEVLEGFLARHPDRSAAYGMLTSHYASLENDTRTAEVFARWAQAIPGDQDLVERWMGSNLPRLEPEATARLLDDFFAGGPRGEGALDVCHRVARSGPASHAAAARSCLARLAAHADNATVAERATSALVESAAAEGDWSMLRSALETLPPDKRAQATISAARRLETPERCGERIDLLGAVRGALPADGSLHSSVADALEACKARPAGEALYLDLLGSVPGAEAHGVVWAWLIRFIGVPRGELPAAAGALLEQRLRDDPDEEGLYRALDVVYQLDDPDDRRLDLLRGWQERFPESIHFRAEHAVALAEELLWRDQPEAAIRSLESRLDRRYEAEVAETLGMLYLETGGLEQARRFAGGLIASGQPLRAAGGHLLAARLAALETDFAAAERHYWEAGQGGLLRREVAAEMLAAVAAGGGEDRLPGLARRICEETPLGQVHSGVTGCAAELLAEAGTGEAAAGFLRQRAGELPEDVGELRKVAGTAQQAGQLDVAEQAMRRILEVDPRSESGWTHLGVFLEKQERLEDLERLLERARRELPAPPVDMLRAVGRARVAAGDSKGGLEALQEAREALPPGSEPAWLDHELGAAYEALGGSQARDRQRSAPDPAALDGYRRASELGDAVSMFEFARLTLTREGSGRPCEEGLAWLERSAQAGHPGAAAFLGKLLFYGRGECVRAAPERALKWLEDGAAAGEAGAESDLGLALLTGGAGTRDVARGVALLEQGAARPDRFAAEVLAFVYAAGVGVERDPERARRLLAEAVRLGSDGFPELAKNSTKSLVVKQLFLRGVERLTELAEGGDAAAAGLLSRLYSTGRGVVWDWDEAVRLARPAAAAGDPEAMRTLAHAYRHGTGVGEDTAEAIRWWRRGAEAGNSFSMMFYSQILMRGELVDRDLETGLAWLHRAAEAGNWWAIGDLGRLYDEAWYGLPRDPDQAAAWKRLRARGGDAEARGWLVAHGYPLE